MEAKDATQMPSSLMLSTACVGNAPFEDPLNGSHCGWWDGLYGVIPSFPAEIQQANGHWEKKQGILFLVEFLKEPEPSPKTRGTRAPLGGWS